MTIDRCSSDFATLSTTVLPAHLARLRDAMRAPLPMAGFALGGVGVRSLLKRHGHADDFSGCYVFIADRPIYVGISRRVFSRIRQHVTGETHFDASLAYRMAEAEAPHGKTRSTAMTEPEFAALFRAKRAELCTLQVATIRIDDPLELYLFEVYAAMALDTSKWNTFRTH